jgi:imidazolonepropionase-like amidohydrolase
MPAIGSRMALGLMLAAGAVPVRATPVLLAPPVAVGKDVQPYVRVPSGRIALAHVRIVDGTGAPAQADRTILLDGARIAAIQPGDAPVPAGTTVLDLHDETVLPGLVGMHDHFYYIARPDLDAEGNSQPPMMVPEMAFSAPRLYLALGVTTLRTTGSVEPYTDLNLKRDIDAGRLPGPHMDVTGPYLEGEGGFFLQMHAIADPDEARRMVAYWADAGVTSFKAYTNITRAELKAAIDEAHRRGLKITGHLCAVTYAEAAVLGIDDLEHGFSVNTQNDPGKTPDHCSDGEGEPTLLHMAADGADAKALIKLLVERHVAITSTFPVIANWASDYRPLTPRELDVLSPQARNDYFYIRNVIATRRPAQRKAERAQEYANGEKLERAFVAAGGLLLAGPDPTGNGDVIPGFGDLREIELLVHAGFTPLEAIRIGTLNGAVYLGLTDRIGSIAPGKDADLLVVKGDPSVTIEDIEQTDLVFKDGVGFDSAKLIESVKGRYGQY